LAAEAVTPPASAASPGAKTADGLRIKPPPYEAYVIDEDLAAATEISIRLRQPLLLTGDPGTGKTRFAKALAHHLNMPLVICNIRSTTTVSDLFYSIDEVARFRDKTPGPVEEYIVFNGLGRAILYAGGPGARIEKIRDRMASRRSQDATATPFELFYQLYPEDSFPAAEGRQVVVLLDEFDKAPRDTPNDMLNELEEMGFAIPELGIRVAAPRDMRPIVVITSNSERSLPDPFLRRCIYHDIPFPTDTQRLREIVWGHLKPFDQQRSPLLDEVLDLFVELRNARHRLSRRPGTAELLDWLRALTSQPANLKPSDTLKAKAAEDDGRSLQLTLSAIVKARDDRNMVENVLRDKLGIGRKP
jgi:MoxR-like ATPase